MAWLDKLDTITFIDLKFAPKMRSRYTYLGKNSAAYNDYQAHLCSLLYLRCLRQCHAFYMGGTRPQEESGNSNIILAWKPLGSTKFYACMIQVVDVPSGSVSDATLDTYREAFEEEMEKWMTLRTGTGEVLTLQDIRQVLYTNKALNSVDNFLVSECNLRRLLDSGGKCMKLPTDRVRLPCESIYSLLCHSQGNVKELRDRIVREITHEFNATEDVYFKLMHRMIHWWDEDARYYFLTDKSSLKFTTGLKRKMKLFLSDNASDDEDDFSNQWGETAVFLRAVAAGKLPQVLDYVRRQGSLDVKDDDGNSALHVTALADQVEVAEALLDAGLGMEARNDIGRTPLLVAAASGSLGVLALLLERGASRTQKDYHKNSAVHLAVACKTRDMLSPLLSDRASLVNSGAQGSMTRRSFGDTRNCKGFTPLLIAAMMGKTEYTRALLAAGANRNAFDKAKRNALHWAVIRGHTDTVQFLLEDGFDMASRCEGGVTPFLLAASVGNVAVLKLLMERGADVEAVDDESLSAMHRAAARGHDDTVRFLAASAGGDGGDVNIESCDFTTPLHLAAAHGRRSTVLLLMELGARPRDKDRVGWSALHLAAAGGHRDVAEALLDTGALSVQVRDFRGRTPLHEAAAQGRLPCVRLLVESRASVNARTKEGSQVPLHLAAQGGHVHAVQLLVHAGSVLETRDDNGETALHMAARAGQLDMVRYLAEGCDVTAGNRMRESALHLAAQYGHLDVVKFLVRNGGDGDAEDSFGRAAVDVAVQCGHVKVVKHLVACGCGVGNRDSRGATLLHVAAWYGHADIVEFLAARRGMDVNARDHGGQTPLHKAAVNGHGDATRILLVNGAEVEVADRAGVRPMDMALAYKHEEVEDLLRVMTVLQRANPSTSSST